MNAQTLDDFTHSLTKILPGVSIADITFSYINRPAVDHPLDDWTPLLISIDPWPSDPVDVIKALQIRQIPFDVRFDLSYFPRYTRMIIEPEPAAIIEYTAALS